MRFNTKDSAPLFWFRWYFRGLLLANRYGVKCPIFSHASTHGRPQQKQETRPRRSCPGQDVEENVRQTLSGNTGRTKKDLRGKRLPDKSLTKSGRHELNVRPLRPERSALPG